MAIITYSGVVSDIRGKFGSTVFKGGRAGGGIVQQISTCNNVEIDWERPWGIIQGVRRLWLGLPPEQKTLWTDFFCGIEAGMRAFRRIVTKRYLFLKKYDIEFPKRLPGPEDPWWYCFVPPVIKPAIDLIVGIPPAGGAKNLSGMERTIRILGTKHVVLIDSVMYSYVGSMPSQGCSGRNVYYKGPWIYEDTLVGWNSFYEWLERRLGVIQEGNAYMFKFGVFCGYRGENMYERRLMGVARS
jgi:hypothetical protein